MLRAIESPNEERLNVELGSGKRTKTALVLDAATLGRGDDQLGSILAISFLRTLAFHDDVPETVVCYNAGVTLAEQGSPALPFLEAMAQKGADIVLCGTCVNYFRLGDRLAVGRVGDMHGIVEALMQAERVIRL